MKNFTKFLCLAACAWLTACTTGADKRTERGVIVTTGDGTKVRVEAVTDRILHVSATPGKFGTRESLTVVHRGDVPAFSVESGEDAVTLRTAGASATVDRATGRVTVLRPDGSVVVEEHARSFAPIEVEGDRAWTIRQVFESPEDEAFYGLGQHQSDEFNYKGRNETLYQYNTKVSVPFILSSRNYGILWENYSLTRWGDPRDYAQLDEAFEMDAPLHAVYTDMGGAVLERDERRLDYSDLDKVADFPEDFLSRFYGSTITWSGDLKAREDGVHRFILYYAGYTKVFVDGREVVPEHWRTAWNPNSVKFEVDMKAGQSCPVRVEWQPDGGVSYISLKALTPVAPEEQQRMSWWSELGDHVDYYVVVGDNPDEVISGYRTLTGKSPIMPKWAMGYWQSRERYKTQDELLDALAEYRRRAIGLDNIVLDWSYWEEDAWGSMEMDASRFPDPKGMIDEIHRQDARIMISTWPKFYVTTDHYKELDAMGAIYPQAVRDSIRDWIGPGYIGSFYDAYDPEARKAFWNMLSEHLFSIGMDAWWMDASEPDILSNASLEYRKKLQGPTWLGNSTRYLNTYALVNAMAIYDGQRGERPDQRVFLLTRSGFAGLQRYSTATWSGDIGTCWEDMKAQISAGLNFSMSGIPYWTQDIGGFSVKGRFERAVEGSEDMEEWRELNARWHQWGAFCPLYRSHGQYPFREIFNIAPETHPAYKSMVYYNRLRYRLMPYIYTLASRTWFDDYTIMRGLVMDFNGDTEVYGISDQFMFGDAMMVCPVHAYKARSREVYLPKKTGWYDFYTDAHLDGGGRFTAQAPYERIPIYVREGAIIPQGTQTVSTAEKTDGRLEISVYAGRDGAFVLYEDDGTSYGYERGLCARIPMAWNEAEGTFTLGAREGSFEGMAVSRPVEVRFIAPSGVRTVSTVYDGTAQVLTPR